LNYPKPTARGESCSSVSHKNFFNSCHVEAVSFFAIMIGLSLKALVLVLMVISALSSDGGDDLTLIRLV
jgi:hypothetical protein